MPEVLRESPIAVQTRVLSALILREMRTRYGRTFFGWMIMVLWPLSHLLFIVLGYILVHRVAPIGTDVTTFVGTGVLPYILCLYPARMIMFSIPANQSLLLFPIVHVVDIIVARGVLEIINAFWVVFLFCCILWVCGVDFMPRNVTDAVMAILATVYLGFAIGVNSAVLYRLSKGWLPIQVGLLLLGYITSGAFLPISFLPSWAQDILWFNPLVHSVEWLRSAYYDQFGAGILSRAYLVSYSTVLILITLVLERGLRGLLMIQR